MTACSLARAAALGIAAAACTGAFAQSFSAKPGLWENTITTQISGAPPMDMSRMSPEQRARIEEMMKKREAMGPREHTHRSCITKEDLERGPQFERNDNCKYTVTSRSATRLAGTAQCTHGEMTSSGDFMWEVSGGTSMRGVMHNTMQRNGKEQKVTVNMEGKWLGSDCGDVKPRAAPKKP